MSRIIREILNCGDQTEILAQLDKYIAEIAPKKTAKNKGKNSPTNRRNTRPNTQNKAPTHSTHTSSKLTGNRAKRKPSEYARMQKLYKQNPIQAAEQILAENPINITQTPTVEQLEKYYTKIFAKQDIKLKKAERTSELEVNLAHPITVTEIHEQLLKLKESAPGIDGIDRQMLREMPHQDLHALLNILWGMHTMPSLLRQNEQEAICSNDCNNCWTAPMAS